MGWLDDLNKDLKKKRQKFKESGLTDGKIRVAASVTANNHSRAQGSDPNWSANVQKMLKERHADPEWQEKNRQKNKEMAKDEDWLEANRAGAKRRSEHGKWLKENDIEEYKRYFGTVDNHKEETIAQMKVSATNRWKDEEQRKAQSERMKAKPKQTIVCEHCGKEMSTTNYKKYGHHTAQCQIYTVMIEGIKYFNVSDAEEKLGIKAVTIRSRLKSQTSRWTEWYFLE